MLLGRMLRVSGYEQQLLAAARDGAKAGQPGRAHVIVPAEGMQGGALMDDLRSNSEEEVGVCRVTERTNSRLVETALAGRDYLCSSHDLLKRGLTDADSECPCTQVRLPAEDLRGLRVLAANNLFEVIELCLSDEKSDGPGEYAYWFLTLSAAVIPCHATGFITLQVYCIIRSPSLRLLNRVAAQLHECSAPFMSPGW